jgi:hypothetical protein
MIGHRKSIDIDLFTDKSFNAVSLTGHLTSSYPVSRIHQAGSNIWCIIKDVKVDLITHQYPILKPIEKTEGIRMLSIEDIAAMKMHAIFQSGSRLKDFVDIHFLLEKMPLEVITRSFVNKYPHINEPMAHRGLLHHNSIDHSDKIDLLSAAIPFNEIAKRLNQAVQFPSRIFSSIITNNISQDLSKKKKGRRL